MQDYERAVQGTSMDGEFDGRDIFSEVNNNACFLIRVGAGGRVTLPREIRSHLHLEEGGCITFRLDAENQCVKMTAEEAEILK